MSAAVDTNILVYATDSKSAFHKRARTFLEQIMSSETTIYFTWDILHSFLRLTTNASIFSPPLDLPTAVSRVDELTDHPSVRVLAPTPESWKILSRLIKDLFLRGPIISDAVTASVLEANDVKTIYTNDRDFWKFPALKPVDPFK